MLALAGQVLGDSLLRSQYDVSGEDGLAKDWWPDDPEASNLASYASIFYFVRAYYSTE